MLDVNVFDELRIGLATAEDIRLMVSMCHPRVRVKASGGIRTLDAALAALSLGASRIGTSSTAAILKEASGRAENGMLTLMSEQDATAHLP